MGTREPFRNVKLPTDNTPFSWGSAALARGPRILPRTSLRPPDPAPPRGAPHCSLPTARPFRRATLLHSPTLSPTLRAPRRPRPSAQSRGSPKSLAHHPPPSEGRCPPERASRGSRSLPSQQVPLPHTAVSRGPGGGGDRHAPI